MRLYRIILILRIFFIRPEYTVHPEDILIEFAGPEDRIIRVPDGVSAKMTDREKRLLILFTEDPGYTKPMPAEKMSASRKPSVSSASALSLYLRFGKLRMLFHFLNLCHRYLKKNRFLSEHLSQNIFTAVDKSRPNYASILP